MNDIDQASAKVKEALHNTPVSPRAHDFAAINNLANALLSALKKDQDLRKWAVEMALKSSVKPGDLPMLADQIYDFAAKEYQRAVDEISGEFSAHGGAPQSSEK